MPETIEFTQWVESGKNVLAGQRGWRLGWRLPPRVGSDIYGSDIYREPSWEMTIREYGGRFDTDRAAYTFVKEQAAAGDELAQEALNILLIDKMSR